VALTYDHLEGLTYVPGVEHCWKLVRRFYRDNFEIELGDYPIPNDWDSDKLNLIEMIYEREGFHKVDDWSIKTLRPGDLLCVAMRRSNPNHFVIYVGENKILHHPLMQFSRTETLRDFWRQTTCFVLRHKDVPDLTAILPSTTIQELADARYRPQAEA
jgi:cell wall-associated NlpC family hydrolase